MLSLIILGLCLAKTILAIPNPLAAPLKHDDLIVLSNDGRHQRTNYSAWAAKLSYEGVLLHRPNPDENALKLRASDLSLNKRHTHASCNNTYQYIITKTETFLDWDAQMSGVVCASNSSMDVFIAEGYTIQNMVTSTINIGAGSQLSQVLSVSLGISYTELWGTSETQQDKFTVNSGQCGAMITKPIVTRRSGTITQGCLGAREEVGTFYADSHRNGSYGHLTWVEGAVGLCVKNQTDPPLSRCHGEGDFV